MQKLMAILQCDQPSWVLLQLRKFLIFIPIILIKICMLMLLVQIIFILYASMQKKLQKRKLLWLIFALSICSFIWNFQHHMLKKKIAFVVKESAFVYAGPESTFHTIFQLKSGVCVQVLDGQSTMSQITFQGQHSWQNGWIDSDDIELP